MKNRIAKRIIAVVLALILVMTGNLSGFVQLFFIMGAKAADTAQTIRYGQLICSKGLDALNVKVYDSVTGDDMQIIDADSQFGIKMIVDPDEASCTGFRIVFLPYDSDHSLEDFVGFSQNQSLDHEDGVTYGRLNPSVWSEDYNKYEVDIPKARLPKFDGTDSETLPSGIYSAVCVYYVDDITAENPRAKLMFSDKVIRISNKRDGGYISDEAYGYEDRTQYVELKVNAYVGGTLANNNDLDITVYDSFGESGICFGSAPCMVPAESRVKIKISPINDARELVYNYAFSENGSAYFEETVSISGSVDLYIDKLDDYTLVSGNVFIEDKDGSTKVAAGATVSVIQHINGKNKSFVTTTNSQGEYSLSVHRSIPATVIAGEKYYSSYEQEVSREIMSSSDVKVDAKLKKSEKEDDSFTKGIIRVPVKVTEKGYYSVTGILFDTSGNIIDISRKELNYSVETPECAEGILSFEIPEGEYKIIVFDDSFSSSAYIHSYIDVANILNKDDYIEEAVAVEKMELVTLESKLLPENKSGKNTPISKNSFISAPCQFNSEDEKIKISGHIECEAGDLEIKKLYISAMDKTSNNSYALQAATYTEGTLIVESNIVGLTVQQSSRITAGEELVLSEPLKGTTDFTLRLDPTVFSNIDIRVYADVNVNGISYDMLEVGTAEITGLPVTLDVNTTTASGKILVSGTVNTDSVVHIFDNGVEVGRAIPDKALRYESYIQLSNTRADNKSTHELTAVCNENVSAAKTVFFDPDASVLRGIYLMSNGKIQPKKYVWTPYIEISFKAVFENMLTDDGITIFVLCSDGTVVELPATKVENEGLAELSDVEIATFVTEEYPFGEKKLIPKKAWAIVGGSEEKPETPEYTGIVHSSDYKEKDDLDTIQWQIEECISTDYPTPENLPEDYSGFGYITYTTEVAEVEDMAKQGAHHTRIVDDNGQLIYDCYLLIKNGTTMYGYIDYYDADNYGQAYVLMSSIITNNGFSTEIQKVYNSFNTEINSFDASEISYQRSIGSQVAIAEQQGQMWGETFINKVGPYVYDVMVDAMNSSLGQDPTAKAGTIKGIPIGDLLTVKSVGESGMDYYNVSQESIASNSQLMFYKSLLVGISSKDAVDVNSFNRINASLERAMSSFDRATDIYKRRFVSNVETAIVCKAADYAGPYGQAAGVVGGMVGGMMIDDMAVNGEVTLIEARGEYLETQLYLMKAMGISKADLDELYADYQKGMTFYGIRKKLKEKTEENEAGENYEAVIDPSGYIYEAVASNRIEGATVTIYDSNMNAFDAENYDQMNPLLSDSDGRYAWDVPEGLWLVRAFKDGYLVGDSQNAPTATVSKDDVNYLPVLPIQLDINIPLMSESKAKAEINYDDGKYYLVFDKYVILESITDETLEIVTNDGTRLKVEACDSEKSPLQTPVCGGKMLARTFEIKADKDLTADAKFTVSISKELLAYNGKGNAITLKNNGGVDANPEATIIPTKTPDNLSGDKTGDTDEKTFPVGLFILIGILLLGGAVTVVVIVKKKKA